LVIIGFNGEYELEFLVKNAIGYLYQNGKKQATGFVGNLHNNASIRCLNHSSPSEKSNDNLHLGRKEDGVDGLTLHGMARELHRELSGALLDKVIQPSRDELLLRFWTGHARRELYLRVGVANDTLFLSTRRYPAPQRPPRFCQLLRARTKRLLAVEAVPGERILRFDWLSPTGEPHTLMAEMFGPQGNLLLLDEEWVIVDLWRRQEEGGRPLLPRQPYLPPDQRDSDRDSDMGRLLETSPAVRFALKQTAISGRDVAAREEFIALWESGTWQPCRVTWPGGEGVLPFPWQEEVFDTLEPLPSLSEVLERTCFSGTADKVGTTTDARQQMLRIIRKQYARLDKRLKHMARDREKYADPERDKQLGDLLLANLHRIERGVTEVTLDDWYREPVQPVTIPLDSKLSPQQNAERLYHRYRKGMRAEEHLQRRQKETEQEREWLQGLELALDDIDGGDDLALVQQELEQAGLLRRMTGKLARRSSSSLEQRLHRATTPGGFDLTWGRNPAGNDLISRRKTGANDLWFHAKDLPGCHLCLKRVGDVDIPEEDVLYAASFAAGYSKGRHDSKVEVMVASGRDVKKPKGVPAGLVTVGRYRTVMVEPRRLDEAGE